MSDHGVLKTKAFPSSSTVQVVEAAVGDCAIESVVVYQDRAEVKRAVPVHLYPGENEVIIFDLAECVDKNSIRVEGRGKAVITDVIYSSETSSEDEKPSSESKEKYEALKAEIADTQRESKNVQFKEEVLKKERGMLKRFADHVSKIHSVDGKHGSLSQLVDQGTVAVVLEFFDKYEAKCADIDDRLSALYKDQQALSEKIAALQANADKINPKNKKISKDVVRAVHVGLEVAEEVDAVLYVSYVVTNASWSSAYDIRVFTKDKSMKVQYYGLIKQQTGEDWKDARISLSTAQPSVGGAAPFLPTKLIQFHRPPPRAPPPPPQLMRLSAPAKYGLSQNMLSLGQVAESISSELDESEAQFDRLNVKFGASRSRVRGKKLGRQLEESPPPPPAVQVAVTEVSTGLFNTTYGIPRATTIPADNTEHKVTVALVDLSPEFNYTSVPRLSPHSFLQAKAKNTSNYTMLAGPSNIFLDNNFIAKSDLGDVSPNEEFTTSLGVDQSIRITCQPIATLHHTRGGLLGGAKTSTVTYTHTFEVKNTRADAVDMTVLEQVPLSTDERIKVIIQQPDLKKPNAKCAVPGGYALLNDSNNVEWHVKVEPGAELELKLVYIVEHPAQDAVEGLPKQ